MIYHCMNAYEWLFSVVRAVRNSDTLMGRTIPSFRIAAEIERAKWRDFRSILNKEDRKLFDEMLSYSRLNNSACMIQAKPIVFYSVMMSILFHHYKQLMEL